MRCLNDHDKESLISDIIYHCVRDDFAVLRKYDDLGYPFEAWLYKIAHRIVLDWLKRKKREKELSRSSDDKDPNDCSIELADHHGHSQPLLEMVRQVKALIPLLGKNCQLLLKLAAEEYTPKEMALVLQLSSDQNKKVSDDLRYCRQRLKNLMWERGFDLRVLIAKEGKG
jgi:RNA polymerase sigma factor (sigma-70 family)